MATATSQLYPASSARLRLLTFPREHGAWGLLLVPLITGAAVGYRTPADILPVLLFTFAALALFCLRTPFESLLASSPIRPQTPAERQAVVKSIVIFASAASCALAAVLIIERAWGLVILGAIAGSMFLFQAFLKKLGRAARTGAQIVGALGLASTAAAAYYLEAAPNSAGGHAAPWIAHGAAWISELGFPANHLIIMILILWGVNGLFAVNQIQFVQLRIHAARAMARGEKLLQARSFLAGEAVTLAILLAGWGTGLLSYLTLLAFSPILVRGVLWVLSNRTAPLNVRRLGLSELAHGIVFGVLLILSFRLGV